MRVFKSVLTYIILLSAIGIVCLLTYWLSWPYKIIEITKVEVLTPIVVAGEDVQILIESKKYMNVPAIVRRELLNDHAWGIPSHESNIPATASDWTLRIKIPENAPFGTNYRIHTTYSYRVNPVREVTVEWMTPTFTVHPKLGK